MWNVFRVAFPPKTARRCVLHVQEVDIQHRTHRENVRSARQVITLKDLNWVVRRVCSVMSVRFVFFCCSHHRVHSPLLMIRKSHTHTHRYVRLNKLHRKVRTMFKRTVYFQEWIDLLRNMPLRNSASSRCWKFEMRFTSCWTVRNRCVLSNQHVL